MFNQILSRVAINPSAVNQLAFYSQRLKKEESVRRLGLFFVVLSMFVQIGASMFPAEKSLAASNNDVIYGGVSTITDLKNKYKQQADVQGLYNRFGLNADDLTAARAQNTTFKFQEQGSKGTRTVGRINFATTKDRALGPYSGTTFYSRSAGEWQGSAAAYYFGKHKGTDNKMYYVWVLKDCGNIAYRAAESTETPTPKPEPKPTPTPTPEPTPVIKPDVECTRLVADRTTGTKSVNVRFTAQYYANQPYLVDGLTFEFGDGDKIKHNGPIIDHTYTNNELKKKSFVAKVTINSTVGNKTASACRVTIDVLPEVCAKNPSVKPTDVKCGVCQYNPALTPDDPRCKAEPVCANNPELKPNDPKCVCADNPSITADNPACSPPLRQKKVQNITQKLSPEATLTTPARGGDVLEYSLITVNPNPAVARSDYTVDDYLGDILDYAVLDKAFLDQQQGSMLPDQKTIVWKNQRIGAGDTLTRKFRITMKNPVPATNAPNATATDFDCKMQNGYGNETVVPVACPVLKQVESLPNTGPGTTIAVAFTVTVIASYFFARTRLLSKEALIIKKTYQHAGV